VPGRRAALAPIEAIDTSPERVQKAGESVQVPVEEPFAWVRPNNEGLFEYEDGITAFANDPDAIPLYTAPPDTEALRKELERVKGERDAWNAEFKAAYKRGVEGVNCCPGSPGWPVALRDSTIDTITDACFQSVADQGTTVLMRAVARAVERQHGIAAQGEVK